MKENLAKLFGKRLKEIRKSKGLTQAELSEKIEMEEISLSKIETGTRFPQKENIQKIAEELGCEVKDLFDFRYQLTEEALRNKLLTQINKMNEAELKFLSKVVDAYYEI